jgi:hypothetical protein
VKVAAHGGSPSESLCRRPATQTRPELRCPFFDECPWQEMRRQAGRARFVFMTHSHLTSHWPPAGRPGILLPRSWPTRSRAGRASTTGWPLVEGVELRWLGCALPISRSGQSLVPWGWVKWRLR